jgi:hypothetical protein
MLRLGAEITPDETHIIWEAIARHQARDEKEQSVRDP